MTPALNPLQTVAILAGGLATRLRPMTETVPKSLLEVNGEPFAVHQLRLLQSKGIRRVVFCVGHLGEMIEQTIGNGSTLGLQVDYSFDGPALLGTAGAVRKALPRLGDSFFVMYGDSYLPCDYAAIARQFQTAGVLGMMTVFRNEGKWDTSNVEFEAGNDSRVQQDGPYTRHAVYRLRARSIPDRSVSRFALRKVLRPRRAIRGPAAAKATGGI